LKSPDIVFEIFRDIAKGFDDLYLLPKQKRSQMALPRETEGWRQDADDEVRAPVERNLAADDGGICAEATFPNRVGQDHDTIAAVRILLLMESSAQLRANA